MGAGATIRVTATTIVATVSAMTISTARLIVSRRPIENEVETTQGNLRADRDPTTEGAINAIRSGATSICPRGEEREVVHDARGREYTLRGSESRTVSTAGAFRVVPSRELWDHDGRRADAARRPPTSARPRTGETVRVPGQCDVAVTLTDRGGALEARRRDGHDPRQEYYAGVKRERELEHDVQVYDAYLRAADRLAERGAEIERVVLDYELKREYQEWLHARDRERDDYDGHPNRTDREIEDWAHEHDLPYFDDQVHFPDLRIEYRDADGRHDHEDVEVVTMHYRGAHGAAVARSGFTCHRGSSARVGGRGGCGGRGGGHHGGLAEELWD